MKIIACDQSFQRPGFALLDFDEEQKRQQLIRKSNIDNKSYQATHHKPEGAKRKEPIKKPHGQVLSEIAKEFHSYLKQAPDAILVREEALDMVKQSTYGGMKSSTTIKVLHKVIGVTDLYAWANNHKIFEELHPFSVKRLLTGDHLADKKDVARVLPFYVGEHIYECDDESDAVAVGVSWLLEKNLLTPAELPEDFFPPKPEKEKKPSKPKAKKSSKKTSK